MYLRGSKETSSTGRGATELVRAKETGNRQRSSGAYNIIMKTLAFALNEVGSHFRRRRKKEKPHPLLMAMQIVTTILR